MSDDSDSDGSFGEWDEADVESSIVSLVGSHTVPDARSAWAEIKSLTGVDIPAEASKRNWDAYALVRVINALRRAGHTPEALSSVLSPSALSPSALLWSDDASLLPVLMDDALIMAVVSGGSGEEEEGEGGEGVEIAEKDADVIAALREELALARAALKRMTSSGEGGDSDSNSNSSGSGGDESDTDNNNLRDPHAGDRSRDNLTYYFDSYASRTGIHRTMLADAPRTLAYKAGIERGGFLAGKRVLDLGCGSGILSLFAAAAGASAVVALDASSVADDAAKVVRANKGPRTIAVVFGRAEVAPLERVRAEAEALPEDSRAPAAGKGFCVLEGALSASVSVPERRVFDAIVSEWMGYGLLYESMFASVIAARDTYLKPGGMMLPSRASLSLGAVSDTSLWADKVTWWNDVYGYNLDVFARDAFPEPLVEAIPASSLGSLPPHARVTDWDLTAMTGEEQDVKGVRWVLQMGGETGTMMPVHALCVWFDVTFGDERYWPKAGGGGGGGAIAKPRYPI
jgi:protein arginine N-methyltransferase 3